MTSETPGASHQSSAAEENRFIEKNGLRGYGRWYLGVDDGVNADTKGYYKFPYGDFRDVHRCGLLAAESRAGQRKYVDIERAAAHLHGMIEAAHRDRFARSSSASPAPRPITRPIRLSILAKPPSASAVELTCAPTIRLPGFSLDGPVPCRADRTQEPHDLRGHVVTVSNPDKRLFPRRRHHEGRGGPLLQAGRHADDAPPGRAARRLGA